MESLKAGRTLATNGPLLGLSMGGAQVGEELQYPEAQKRVDFTVALDSIAAVEHLDLVCNGRVVRSFVKGAARDHVRAKGSIPLAKSGWCLLRASSDGGRYPVLDNYVYATTSPIYVRVAGLSAQSPPDALFFQAWVDRVTEATTAYPDWNSQSEKSHVLDRLQQARAAFVTLQHGIPAP
jgi:hypothetical protein